MKGVELHYFFYERSTLYCFVFRKSRFLVHQICTTHADISHEIREPENNISFFFQIRKRILYLYIIGIEERVHITQDAAAIHGRPSALIFNKALFRFQNSLLNSTMQKEDSPSHQNIGTYIEY
jgi:hypothetical protein